MKWLLIVIVFELTASGQMVQRMTLDRLFDSEEACDEEGDNFRTRYPALPEHWKSVSICIPESMFDQEQPPASETAGLSLRGGSLGV